MQFDLTKEEAVFITNVVGELPAKTGASALYQKLVQQVQAQEHEAAPKDAEDVGA